MGALRRAWHTQGFARLMLREAVAARVSPPMQRVAVSGGDLGVGSLPLRLAALCVIHFRIRICYSLD